MWQCVEKDWVKEGRQRDNGIESEHCSWETSLSLSEERETVWRGYLFFIWKWKLKSGGESPCGITDWRWCSWGYCLLPLPLSPTPIHFPSPTFLIFTRELPLSLWEKGKEEKKKRSCSFSVPSLPASQSNSIHPTLLWSAELCIALLNCKCIKQSWAELFIRLLPGLSVSTWEA